MPQNGRLGICDVCVNLFLVGEGVLVKSISYILRANSINRVSRKLLGIIDFLVGNESSTNNHLRVIIQFIIFSPMSVWYIYLYESMIYVFNNDVGIKERWVSKL
jgi:hypothetical protein